MAAYHRPVWRKAIAWAVAMLVVGIAGGFIIRLLLPRRRRSVTSALASPRP